MSSAKVASAGRVNIAETRHGKQRRNATMVDSGRRLPSFWSPSTVGARCSVPFATVSVKGASERPTKDGIISSSSSAHLPLSMMRERVDGVDCDVFLHAYFARV